jgi:hypothetical protein
MERIFGINRVSGRRRAVWLLVVLCGLVLFGARAVPARAATIAVDCSTDSSALATALAAASSGDKLTITGTCDGTYEVSRDLTLQGSGGATLDGQSAGSVLTIDPGKTVRVTGLTITDGSTNGIGGGGIFNNGGTLSVSQSVIEGNQALSFDAGFGGGILNQGGTLTVQGSTFGPNFNESAAIDTGDAIANEGGTATITTSTFNAPAGTVIRNDQSGSLTISASTISRGIIAIRNVSGSITLENSTVTGVGEPFAVGAVQNFDTATIVASTISGNLGLGIQSLGTATVSDSIISNNNGDCSTFFVGTITDSGYNLDDDGSCGFSAANHSLSNTNPMLDPTGLADNGGPTLTIALEPGSPAVDAIPPGVNGCGTTVATDQRGVTRPQGPGCDMGAFEAVFTPAQLLAALQNAVNGLPPGTSLADKVAQAITYFDKHDIPDTCSILTAFVNQVKALPSRIISKSEAATLIGIARQTKTLLGC